MPEGLLLDSEDKPKKKKRTVGSTLLEGLGGALEGFASQVPGATQAIETQRKSVRQKRLGIAYAKSRGIDEATAQDALASGLDPDEFLSVPATKEVADYSGGLIKEGSPISMKRATQIMEDLSKERRDLQKSQLAQQRAMLTIASKEKIAKLNAGLKDSTTRRSVAAAFQQKAAAVKDDPSLRQAYLAAGTIVEQTGEIPEFILEKGDWVDNVGEFLGVLDKQIKVVPSGKSTPGKQGSKSLDDIFK